MTDRNEQQRRELLDTLLVQRATQGLDATAEARLRELLDEFPDADAESYERAAAAICLATLTGVGPMPAGLRARIMQSGSVSGPDGSNH